MARGAAAGAGLLLEEQFGADALYGLRQAVQAHAAAAGMSGPRVMELMIAASELAANVIRHGAGRGRLRLWNPDGALRCQVDDAGPVLPAVPAAGDGENIAARWPVVRPHGLWLVRTLADQVDITSGPGGTRATVVFRTAGHAAGLNAAPHGGLARQRPQGAAGNLPAV